MKYNGRYIGTNHLASGWNISKVMSSFDKEFTNEEVLIVDGIGDRVPCMIGDVKEAYILLKQYINNCDINDIEEISECVFNVVQEYFGDYSDVNSRMSFYKDLDYIASEEDIGRVSDLKGKNAAMCVERAMLSQNLLKSLGINSVYKQSDIINNDKTEGHAYNIISYDDKYYIFDSAIPTLKGKNISPLITKIPDYVYEKITSPDASTGYSVIVSHYNPLRDKDVNLTYDAGRKEKYFGQDIKEDLTR